MYTYIWRQSQHHLLTTFDGADAQTACTKRNPTWVASPGTSTQPGSSMTSRPSTAAQNAPVPPGSDVSKLTDDKRDDTRSR